MNTLALMRYDAFIERFKQVYDHPDYAGSAAKRLLVLQQGAIVQQIIRWSFRRSQ